MTDAVARIVGPVALGSSAATVYTVPGSTTVTVRNIHVANESAASHTFRLSIGADAAGQRFFYDIAVAAGAAFDWSDTLVLAAAEILEAYADSAAVLTLTISGVVTT